mgnify:CR=1 FL=1
MAVLVRRPPLNSIYASEALRQSVGLVLAPLDISVLLLDQAAWLSVPLAPEAIEAPPVKKHVDMLLLLKHRVLVERESLERYGVSPDAVLPGVGIVSARQVAEEVAAADAVIVF